MKPREMIATDAQPADSSAPATIFEKLAEKLGAAARATTVFGDAVEREGLTVIPVAKARWGLGGGSGREGRAAGREGLGGGGGVIVQPVGYIEMKNGESRFRPIVTPGTWIAVAAGAVLLFGLMRRARR